MLSPAPGSMKLSRSMHFCRWALRIADAMSLDPRMSRIGRSCSYRQNRTSSAMHAPHSAPSLSESLSAGTWKCSRQRW